MDVEQAVLDAVGVPWTPKPAPASPSADEVVDRAVAALNQVAFGKTPARPTRAVSERPSPGEQVAAPDPDPAPVVEPVAAPSTPAPAPPEPEVMTSDMPDAAPEEMETELELSPAEIAELLAAERSASSDGLTPSPDEELPPADLAPAREHADPAPDTAAVAEPTIPEGRVEPPPSEPLAVTAPPEEQPAQDVSPPDELSAEPPLEDTSVQQAPPGELPPQATPPAEPVHRPEPAATVEIPPDSALAAPRGAAKAPVEGERSWGLQLLLLFLLAGAVALVLYYLLNMG